LSESVEQIGWQEFSQSPEGRWIRKVELLDGWDLCVLSESVEQIGWQEFPQSPEGRRIRELSY
jgi:hypothetical protein